MVVLVLVLVLGVGDGRRVVCDGLECESVRPVEQMLLALNGDRKIHRFEVDRYIDTW